MALKRIVHRELRYHCATPEYIKSYKKELYRFIPQFLSFFKNLIELMLVDEKSLWGADIFIAVSKEVPGAKMERISGTFLAKVFEGHYKDIPKWIKEMDKFATIRNFPYKKIYFSYTTCPKCAKEYGKNYVILFAQRS